jgi:hypothetical protein
MDQDVWPETVEIETYGTCKRKVKKALDKGF